MDQPTIRLMIREKLTDGMSTPAEQELRQQIHARLSEGHLGSVDGGVSKSHQGTGGPCVVCRRSIEPAEVEREVEGAGVCLHAHEACYKLWREESVACRAGGRERVREGAASRGSPKSRERLKDCGRAMLERRVRSLGRSSHSSRVSAKSGSVTLICLPVRVSGTDHTQSTSSAAPQLGSRAASPSAT